MPNLSRAERRWILRQGLVAALLSVAAVSFFVLELRLLGRLFRSEPASYPWPVMVLSSGAVVAIIAFAFFHRFQVKFRGADPLQTHQPGFPMWGVTGNLSGAPVALLACFREAASLATDLHQSGHILPAERLREVIHEPVAIPRLSENLLRELEAIRSGLPDQAAPIYRRLTNLSDSLRGFIRAEEARATQK